MSSDETCLLMNCTAAIYKLLGVELAYPGFLACQSLLSELACMSMLGGISLANISSAPHCF